MQLKQTVTSTLAVFGIVTLLLSPRAAMSDGGGSKYKVTITNLTSGQPITPPILATHSRRTGLFSLAEDASAEIQALAENGDGAPLIAALHADVHVFDVVAGAAPLIPDSNPGATGFESSETFTIGARGRARFLSIASMLICTNDGFTGINSVRLPINKKTVYAVAYDARTEQNTEDFADIVPPCQGLIGVTSDDPGTGTTDPLLAEEGFVIPHVGIHGGADLQPQVHDWSDPVVKIVIERIRHGYY